MRKWQRRFTNIHPQSIAFTFRTNSIVFFYNWISLPAWVWHTGMDHDMNIHHCAQVVGRTTLDVLAHIEECYGSWTLSFEWDRGCLTFGSRGSAIERDMWSRAYLSWSVISDLSRILTLSWIFNIFMVTILTTYLEINIHRSNSL